MLLETVKRTIEEHKMLQPGQRVLCALSGGVDSVVLLHVLHRLGYDVCACHFEHGIRGAPALRDAQFVSQLCEEQGIRLYVEHGDTPAYAARHQLSMEAAARALRYACFARAMQHFGAACCATAHHLDDQAETVLMRLARGAWDGLAGIPYVNGPYIRPLRDAAKQAISAYAREHALAYVTDETNFQSEMTRNRVRNQLLPVLDTIHPGAAANLVRSLALAAQDAQYLDALAAQIPVGTELELQMLQSLAPSLRLRVLRRFAQNIGVRQIDQAQLAALAGLHRTGAALDLPGAAVVCDQGMLRKKAPEAQAFCMPLNFNGITHTPYGALTASVLPSKPPHFKTLPNEQYFDLDRLPAGVAVRSRRAGDWICPIGMNGRKSIKELLIDRKISRDRRGRIPLIADADNGRVYWAAGVCASSQIAVTEDTKRVLHIQYVFKEEGL